MWIFNSFKNWNSKYDKNCHKNWFKLFTFSGSHSDQFLPVRWSADQPLVHRYSSTLRSQVPNSGQSNNNNTCWTAGIIFLPLTRGGIQRPIEPCLRFSGFQRRLFLCIPAQTRDYNTIKTGIPGFSQSQIEPWLKLNVFGIGIFPGKNRFSNTTRIRLLLNTAQSQIEPCLSICQWIPPQWSVRLSSEQVFFTTLRRRHFAFLSNIS
jgi:hypothetical protein